MLLPFFYILKSFVPDFAGKYVDYFIIQHFPEKKVYKPPIFSVYFFRGT